MPEEDATLSEFASGEPDGTGTDEPGDTDADKPGGADAGDRPVEPGGAPDVDPAETTYRWTGTGARCADCDAHVERLWRGQTGLVCGDCKEW